ncbi:MAG: GNAT family N-acetyltransferase [Lachnospiraceae bacterium]|nr:GNAT family N-acetyltransferase [Lachnospiraceae bacterium]
MIRKLEKTDIDRVAEIWLDTNIKAHGFIPAQYWTENFDPVKEMLSQAEVYVYEDENKNRIEGFVGLDDDYIAGIFVWHESQSRGIGQQLLNCVKTIKKKLKLSVYQNNLKAIRFYQREEFKIQKENIDEATGEKEYIMDWHPQ